MTLQIHPWVRLRKIFVKEAYIDEVYRTWRGERGEQWSSAQGLESILISIQSLMSGNPYENEPGFENANSDDDKASQKAYVDKVSVGYD